MLRMLTVFIAVVMSVAAAAAQTSIPPESRLKAITGKKVVRIAYRADAKPFAFVNDKEPVGYTIDLCRLVVKSMEQQFGLPGLKIEWVPVTVDTRFSAVAGNKADMECGSSTVTLGRMKEVDFSLLTFVESTGVLVTRASNFHCLGDMGGKKIAVVYGTTNERAVAEQIRRQGARHQAGVGKGSRRRRRHAREPASVDGFASDKLLLAGAEVKDPEALALLPDDLSIEQYGIVLPRGDWALRLAVNRGLAQVFRSGRDRAAVRKVVFRIAPGVAAGARFTRWDGLPTECRAGRRGVTDAIAA